MIPAWLDALSWLSLGLGAACALGIAADIVRRPQHMAVMNVVWPVTALFGSALIVAQYARYGRAVAPGLSMPGHAKPGHAMPGLAIPCHGNLGHHVPFPMQVANGTLHCGSGCTLGDIVAEWLVFLVPSVAVALGWHSLFADEMYAAWIADFLAAYAFGVVFQYLAIKPMGDLSPGAALWAAVKADTLSLVSWQVGMYGFMAFANLYLAQRLLGVALRPDMPAFWFAMQVAMLWGFATAYPVNWWLIRSGVKEAM